MDYWSITVAGVLGGVGGGLMYWIFSKIFKDKSLHSVGSVVGMILFYQILHPIVYDKMIIPMRINNTLQEIVKINRPLLPRMLDKATRQDSIEAKDLKLKYGYTIVDKQLSIKILNENSDGFKNHMKNLYCQDKSARMLIGKGVVLELSYKIQNTPNNISFEIMSCP